MPEIKLAGIADIPTIREITMQVWPQTYIPIVGEAQVAYMLGRFYNPKALEKQMTESQHRFTVGYDGEKPVAFASWGEVEPGVCKLHKLYISTDVQGRGFGRAMVDRVVSDVREYGANKLRLNVNIHNTPAITFYEKYGFRKMYDEDIDIGEGFFMNDHVYELDVVKG
jgi:diamine N-acetyltransferase